MINMALCLDLISTLKNPFESTRARFYKALLCSFLIPILLVSAIWLISDQRNPTLYYSYKIIEDKPKHSINELYNLLIGFLLSVYMLVGFYSIIFAYRRLVRPGVSIEMRKLFFKKHASYVFTFIFIWILMLLDNYYDLFNPINVIIPRKLSEK
jgi:hypothetical protein